MNIFVLNCGSSSVKFQLINMENESVIAKGIVEKIGSSNAMLTYKPNKGNEIKEVQEILNHDVAIKIVIDHLMHPQKGVIKSQSEITGIGHRMVHGGEEFSDSVLITDKVKEKTRECIKFAPLHNPANLLGVQAAEKTLPGLPNVGVFDTAFHQQMPPKAFMYALPYTIYRKFGIRRYGFHGTSHKYVAQRAADFVKRPLEELKIITCHLGNGASVAAIDKGISIETSMGFTPLEGLMMGTRCGDIDPAIVTYLIEAEKLTPAEVDNLMNKKSGLLGISQTSNDMREIEEAAEAGSDQHQLALDMFDHRVKKYVGSYAAVLGGVDIIVFTGGVGENGDLTRAAVCRGLEFIGVELDEEMNKKRMKTERSISKGKVEVLVIPTNEELAIARDTYRIIKEMQENGVSFNDSQAVAEISQLAENEKAEIVKLWANNPHISDEEIAEAFTDKINKKLEPTAVRTFLANTGLRKA